MTIAVSQLIKERRSVRTYGDQPLSPEHRAALEEFLTTELNPFGIAPEFRLLDAKESKLSSPVIVGTDTYLGAKVTVSDNFEVGYGYAFERVCLFAQSLGLGTVILAGTLDRPAFEKAMDLREGEVLPVVTPLGYPARKMSLRETMMRKGVKADKRVDFNKLFFEGAYGNGLEPASAGVFADALEMVRWAPSAVNKQPWRVVVQGKDVHFYEEQTTKVSPSLDIQRVDMGIALCHFDLVMQEQGHTGSFVIADPGLVVPENVRYIATYQLGD